MISNFWKKMIKVSEDSVIQFCPIFFRSVECDCQMNIFQHFLKETIRRLFCQGVHYDLNKLRCDKFGIFDHLVEVAPNQGSTQNIANRTYITDEKVHRCRIYVDLDKRLILIVQQNSFILP